MTQVADPFEPTAVIHVDLDQPIAAITHSTIPGDSDAEPYTQAFVVALLHGHPLGSLVTKLPPEGLSAEQLAQTIWNDLSPAILQHLREDSLALPTAVPLEGFEALTHTQCWAGEPSADAAPLVSVVIATKDRANVLGECLATLLKSNYGNFEVLVIDNGSTTTETADMIRERFGDEPRLRYFSETQAGTSLARNRGISEARGEIVAFTDDDVVVHPNWIRAIARRFTIEPDVDCVTGLVLPAEFNTQPQLWFEEYGGFSKGYEAKTYDERHNPGYTVLYPYTAGVFGSGNSAAFRTSQLAASGGFDLRLGPGTPARAGEDLDVFLALITSGRSIAYEPAAMILHFHRSDLAGLERQLFNYGIGLTAVFAKWSLRHPRHLWGILRRLPVGLWMVLSPKSPKNAKKSSTFPPELGKQEIKGMFAGPFAFALSAAKNGRRKTKALDTKK